MPELALTFCSRSNSSAFTNTGSLAPFASSVASSRSGSSDELGASVEPKAPGTWLRRSSDSSWNTVLASSN